MSAPGPYVHSPEADRTELAWSRSALSLAASGVLIARSAFIASLAALGLLAAIAMAAVALLADRQGRVIFAERAVAGARARPQTRAFGMLTAVTVLTALAAVIVTITF